MRPDGADLEALDEETVQAMQGDASRILQLAREIQTHAPRYVEGAEAPRMLFHFDVCFPKSREPLLLGSSELL